MKKKKQLNKLKKQQLEARVNELREQVLGKNTNAAFGQAKPVETAPDKTIEALKPEPEAPTPTPAATDTTKAADEAPTEPLEDNSKALKKESSAYYDKVMQSKEPLPADFTGKMLDSLRSNSAGNAIGDVKDADNPVNQLMDRYEKGGLRNQRITMGDVKTVDEKLGDIISSNLKDDGSPTALGHQAWEAQDKLREMAAQAPGGQDLQDARKYYQQGSKLRDLERIQEKADLTKNPATSIQSGIRTLLTSKRGRGYDADEVKALNKAAKDGIMGGALHLLGNRLIPAAAGIAEGLSGGITGGAATAAVTGVGGALARKGATAIKTSRLNKAKDVIVNKAPNGLLSKAKK